MLNVMEAPMKPQAAKMEVRTKASQLIVIGDNAFNNDVLCQYLKNQTGLSCRSVSLADISNLNQRMGNEAALVFVDCAAMGSPRKCQLRALHQVFQNEGCQFVCFNVNPAQKLEYNALQKGVKGLLYNHQPVNLYVRAAEAVLSGELWFPRKILEALILSSHTRPTLSSGKWKKLTRREKEILRMLALGISNQNIADKLCISPHTVKTHIYNLYKKIKVTNRHQAVQWALDHQQRLDR